MVRTEGELAENLHQLDVAANKEIDRFEEFFMKLGNGPLAKPERAILKTFLLYSKVDGATRQMLVESKSGTDQKGRTG